MQEQQVNIEKLNRKVDALQAEIPMQIGKQQAAIEALKKQMTDMKNEIELLKNNNNHL